MKYITSCLLALSLFMTLPTVQARDFGTIKKSGTLQLATEGAFPPFNFFQGNQLSGYEIDVAEAAAKKLGLRIEWKALAFDALIAAVRQGRFDAAIASHGYTEERARSVDFSSPHYCSGGQIVSRTGGPSSVAALEGKVVVVQLATSYADAVARLPGLKETKTLPKDTDALSALLVSRADAWVTDKFVAKSAVSKNSDRLQRGDMVFTEKISFILGKGNSELQAALSKAVDELRADGTLAALGKKWVGEDIATCR
jgi:polar amino acid transport system substrate-binding protein